MSAYYEIHKSLIQSVIDLNLGLPIAHENINFNPESVDEYISVTVLFDEQNTVTKTDLDDVMGFIQISHYVKSGIGTGSSYDLITTLSAAYPHAKQFAPGSSSQTINIQNIAVNRRGNSDGWYITDFTINFWSDISR